MKELEKAAASICGVHPDWSKLECFRIGFKEGAEWQAKQYPWISVDERFPENKETVLVSSQIYGNIVLTWDELGMDWLYPESEDVYCDWNNVDCWMPIPE